MNIAVTGATGFLGHRLVEELLASGHRVRALARKRSSSMPPGVQFSEWRSLESDPPAEGLESAEAVIHLAGEPVAQRWTAEVKQRIRSSRVEGTEHLVSALSRLATRPQLLVSASAIGYYGSRGDEVLTEASSPGEDFLARLAVDWEQAAGRAEALGMRVVRLRIGMVLGKGGALAKMLTPFRLGLGGRLGSGRQWVSWVHIDDVAGLIQFVLGNPALRGAVNATAPTPVTNAQLTKELSVALHRPAVLAVPRLAVKLMFGELGDVILGSQRVLPQAAKSAGFRFKYPELAPALARLLSQ